MRFNFSSISITYLIIDLKFVYANIQKWIFNKNYDRVKTERNSKLFVVITLLKQYTMSMLSKRKRYKKNDG